MTYRPGKTLLFLSVPEKIAALWTSEFLQVFFVCLFLCFCLYTWQELAIQLLFVCLFVLNLT